jgi:adenylate kinase family enzyme
VTRRALIFGNSGSGKTTLARWLAHDDDLCHLDLDQVAWDSPGVRMPLSRSEALLMEWVADHPRWVIEGCYGDLLELVLPYATELHFLNPGTEACVAHCRARPWEPEKYPTRAAQDEMLEFLLDWVRQYETRDDEYALSHHRKIFERFAGPKREITTPDHSTVSDPTQLRPQVIVEP